MPTAAIRPSAAAPLGPYPQAGQVQRHIGAGLPLGILVPGPGLLRPEGGPGHLPLAQIATDRLAGPLDARLGDVQAGELAEDHVGGLGEAILYAANSGTSSNIWNLCVSSVSISPLWTVGSSSRHWSIAAV